MREAIPYCRVHEKFQTERGRWIESGFAREHLESHMKHEGVGEECLLDTPCDVCEMELPLEMKATIQKEGVLFHCGLWSKLLSFSICKIYSGVSDISKSIDYIIDHRKEVFRI